MEKIKNQKITKWDEEFHKGKQFIRCDFTECDFSVVATEETDYFGPTGKTIYTAADLSWTIFDECIFQGAKMDGANAFCSDFWGCDFTGASMRQMDFIGGSVRESVLHGADHKDAKFWGVAPRKANRPDPQFTKCALKGAKNVPDGVFSPVCFDK